MEDSSSGCLIDIQIEESLGRETLMSIDSSNHKEDAATLAVYVFLLLLNFAVAYFGPSTIQKYQIVAPIVNDSIPTRKYASFAIESISPMNQYLILRVAPIFNESRVRVLISSQTDLSNDHRDTDFVSHSLPTTTFVRSNDTTNMLSVFSHRTTSSSSFSTRVIFSGADAEKIQSCVGEWIFGDKLFATLMCSYRTLFAVVVSISGCLFLCKLWATAFNLWHLEQKLTGFLMIAVVLMDNPICGFLLWNSFWCHMLIDTILHCLFVVFMKFFILVLFDSLRFQNRKIDGWFFSPKVLFCAVFFISHLGKSLISVQRTGYSSITSFEKMLTGVHWCIEAVYFCWLVFAAIRAHKEIDVTEKFKFTVYVIVSGVTLVILSCVDFYELSIGFMHVSSYSFVVRVSVENFFVILMTTFHWPYELISDQYLEAHEIKQDVGDLYDSN